MTTERDILQALEGLPTSVLEQVKDFIIFLKETKGSQRPLLKEKALAKKQREAIKNGLGRISDRDSQAGSMIQFSRPITFGSENSSVIHLFTIV